MKKWIGPFLSALFIVLLCLGWIFSSFPISEKTKHGGSQTGKYRIFPVQDENEDGEIDSYSFRVLKMVQKRMDGWLMVLNESIEKEDVSLFKVRFLEILRNGLEWGKEKVDKKVESYRTEKFNINKGKKGRLRETDLETLPLSRIG